MTEPSRPRPKPRRRQQVEVPDPKPVLLPTSAEPIEIPSSPIDPIQDEVEKEDALFIRNQKRSVEGWKKLKELDREASRHSATVSELDGDEYSSPRRKYSQKVANGPTVPRWVSSDGSIPLELYDDDDDDDLVEILGSSRNGRIPKSPSKRKRGRSRSKSITPPPALRIEQIQQAKHIARETLDIAPRTPSPPPIVDDTDDIIALDPELARIAAAVRNQPSQSKSVTEPIIGGPEKVNVTVKWLPHPLDQSGQAQTWIFKIKRSDPFRVVFDEVADLCDILFNDLIICHKHNRLFPSVTPNGLKIWADVELEACNVITYNYLRTQRHESPLPTTFEETARDPSPDSSKEDDAGDSDEENSDDQFKLTLRSAGTTITLKVRPTTTCGAIVDAFLKRAGITAKKSGKGKSVAPSLLIDGEKMNPADPISVADLEDGDCVDVAGL